jgi:hypothetical protein
MVRSMEDELHGILGIRYALFYIRSSFFILLPISWWWSFFYISSNLGRVFSCSSISLWEFLLYVSYVLGIFHLQLLNKILTYNLKKKEW